MKQRTFVSPDSRHRRTTASPAVAVRLRHAGWSEAKATKPRNEPKPEDKSDAR